MNWSDVWLFLKMYGIGVLVAVINDIISYIYFGGKFRCRILGVGFYGIFFLNPDKPGKIILKNFTIYTIISSILIILFMIYLQGK